LEEVLEAQPMVLLVVQVVEEWVIVLVAEQVGQAHQDRVLWVV
jgi:hypothetical protein